MESVYDDNHNLIETRETDVSQIEGVAEEVFLTTYFYDSLDRLQRRVDNLGQTHDYLYDSRFNLAAMADASGPGGPVLERRAFPNGALTVNATNQFGNVTRHSYDGINRQIESEVILTASGQGDGAHAGADLFGVKEDTPPPDPTQGGGDGRVKVRFHWDRNSLRSSQTDDNGNQSQYEYDNLNRLVRQTNGVCTQPELVDRCDTPTTNTYTYDEDDNMVRRVDQNGSVIDSSFDALNRLIHNDITRADGVVGTTATAYEYDGLTRRVEATDNNEPGDPGDDSTVTFAYDSLGRVIEEIQQTGASPPQVISSSWRAENLKVASTYPNGRRVTTTFEGLDRIDQIAGDNGAQTIVDYNYIGPSRVGERLYPANGTRMTYLDDGATEDPGYDGLRRPVQLRHLRENNSLIVGFTQDYDRMNNRLTETKLHDPANSEQYRYDSAYRLTSFERPDPRSAAPLHSEWALDGVGNWTQVDDETREHSSFNEITRRSDGGVTSILSDQNGNVTDDGTHVFAWDYRNRLRSVASDSGGTPVAAYVYDALRRRVRKQVSSSGKLNQTTDFAYDGWQVLEELDGAGNPSKQFVYGSYIDEPLMMDRNPDGGIVATGNGDQRLFYHQNTLSSTFALTDPAGSVLEAYQYDAYGQPTVFEPGPAVQSIPAGIVGPDPGEGGTGNPYLYGGRRYDEESEKFYFRFRYLDPVQGRFLSRDPMRPGAISSLYSFVSGNPINRLDSMGLDDTPPPLGDLEVDGQTFQLGFGLGISISWGNVVRDGVSEGSYRSFSLGAMAPEFSGSYVTSQPRAGQGPDAALGVSDLEGGAFELSAGLGFFAQAFGTWAIPTGDTVLDQPGTGWGPALGSIFSFSALGGYTWIESTESQGTMLQRLELLTAELAAQVQSRAPKASPSSCFAARRPKSGCCWQTCCRGANQAYVNNEARINALVQRIHQVQADYGRSLQQSLMR